MRIGDSFWCEWVRPDNAILHMMLYMDSYPQYIIVSYETNFYSKYGLLNGEAYSQHAL